MDSLATFISDEHGRASYQRSQGVCLRHLDRLLPLTSKADRKILFATAVRRFQEITQQMGNYAAKREAIRRDLITADEEDAYLRALIHLVGANEYSGP